MSITLPLRIELTSIWKDITAVIFNDFVRGESINILLAYEDSKTFEIIVDKSGSALIDTSFNGTGIQVNRYNLSTSTTLDSNFKYYARALETTAIMNIKPITVLPTSALTLDDLRNGGVVGLFNKVNVAQSVALFDNQLQYDNQDTFWDTKIIGGGVVAHDPNNSATDLTVSADGDRIIRQLKEYQKYQSGNAQTINMTYTPDINSNDVSFILRSSSGSFSGSTAGIPFDVVIPQASWNFDKLDGTGPSGITLDFTASQILIISLEWLSVGTLIYGFEINGMFIKCHNQDNANKLKGAYMTTANLPARHDIQVIGSETHQVIGYGDDKNGAFVRYISPNVSAHMKQICTAIKSEGGTTTQKGTPYAPSSGSTPVTIAAGSSIYLAARHSLLYKGIENRVQFQPISYLIGSSDEKIRARIIYNPVIVGGTWAQLVEDGFISAMELNTTITSISGGLTIENNFVYASSLPQASRPEGEVRVLLSKLPFGIGIDADTPISLVLEITNEGLGATEVDFGLNWREV